MLCSGPLVSSVNIFLWQSVLPASPYSLLYSIYEWWHWWVSLQFNCVKCNGYHDSYSDHLIFLEASFLDNENIQRSKKTNVLTSCSTWSEHQREHHTTYSSHWSSTVSRFQVQCLLLSAVDMRGFTGSETMLGGFYGSKNIHMNTRTTTGFNSWAYFVTETIWSSQFIYFSMTLSRPDILKCTLFCVCCPWMNPGKQIYRGDDSWPPLHRDSDCSYFLKMPACCVDWARISKMHILSLIIYPRHT